MNYSISKLLLCIFFFILNTQRVLMAQIDTPLFWLSKARTAIAEGDTLTCYHAVEKAVDNGLFDAQAILNSSSFSFMTDEIKGNSLLKRINENREKLKDPNSLKVETSDLGRFWFWFDSLNSENAEEVFLREYIHKGSSGIQTFYQVRMNQDLNIEIDRIRKLKSFYKSIKPLTMGFEDLRPEIILAAEKLKAIYPEAIFPPIYFLIGSLNNVGTPDGYAGMLIGTEHLCKSPEVELEFLSDIDQLVIFDYNQTVPIVIHEYVHLQQKNEPETSLLELAISEGAADFLTYLLLGKYTDPLVFEYGYANEQELWKNFQNQMHSEDTDEWLFNAYNPETGVPGNMGYFIGFRICESYYRRATEKKKAIKSMLEIKDFERFLDESGYEKSLGKD